MLRKTLIAFAAAGALGCLPMATTASAAHSGNVGHSGQVAARSGRGHVAARGGDVHYARYGGGYVSGPIYDSCAGYVPGYGLQWMSRQWRSPCRPGDERRAGWYGSY